MSDPATLQVLAVERCAASPTRWGRRSIRGAHSANIKERRDCSTALFDPDGRMIAQAEHIPVHLGAMPDAVAAVPARCDPAPGDVYVLNDPFTGGTHLPDITLVSRGRGPGARWSRGRTMPTWAACGRAACRPGATELLQEGLVIPPVRLTDEVLTADRANMRQAGRATSPTCARRPRATRSARGDWRSWRSGSGRRRLLPGHGRAARLRRAADARGRSGELPDGSATGRAT